MNDSVLATRTLVNCAFEESNILLDEMPANIKHKNIIWNISCEKERMLEYSPSDPLYRTIVE
ncbi:hypothetical protein [Selenomonas sp. KH1T6]|uniref:hypothetical protein n=1 Tax=Selenomonas sp. KH1T6 TaxID=3158784 RepID=UPI001114702D